MAKEDIELAEEHIKIAEDIITEEAKKQEKDGKNEKLLKAAFELEKAEADLEEEPAEN